MNTESTQQRVALGGIRILDLTRLLPGAFCSQLLADLGADVLKIEQPGAGDYNGGFAPIHRKESGSFLLLNRNKRSMTLNLKSDAGRSLFLQLAAEADVVLEGFRPGVMERLGLGWPTLQEANPRLIHCAISGYGQTGPLREASGHDMNYMALVGALPLFAGAEGGPGVPGLSIADVGGGSLMAAYSILAALIERSQSGRGQSIDCAMTDGLWPWLSYHAADYLFGGVEPRAGERPFLGRCACYNVHRCADGRYLALGIIEPHFWSRFCEVVNRPQWTAQQWPEGEAARLQLQQARELFLTRGAAQWEALLLAHNIPASRVNTMVEAFAHPQLRERGVIQHIHHPVEGRIPQLGFPVKLSGSPARIRTPPPTLGQHTDEVLQSLGLPADIIQALRQQGAI